MIPGKMINFTISLPCKLRNNKLVMNIFYGIIIFDDVSRKMSDYLKKYVFSLNIDLFLNLHLGVLFYNLYQYQNRCLAIR